MELKVWVDGIQRVVCGANYDTTCQEVVIALASAMGQIGHFTLVERWRDTERPLILNECPLQSLCKWGEYAGEVRFYLVQADKIEYQGKNQQKWKMQRQKLNGFEHNFSPLRSSQHDQAQSRSKSLKRSSTFSGAHIVNYAALASLSSASSQKPVSASVSNSFNQLTWVSSSSSTTKNDHTNHDLIQNGKPEGLLAYSFSGLVSATDHPRSDRIREYSVRCGMEVHTGKITESPMNLSSQTGTYSSSFEQSPSPQSFQQFHHPNQHLSHRHSTGPFAASSKQTNQKPSQNNSTTIRQPSSSQKLQHSSLSQLSFLQNKHSHHKHSQNHSTSMHVESENIHVNKKNHQEPVLQKRLQENISKPALSSRHREKSHDRKAQGTMPSSNSSESQSHSTTLFGETSDCISKQATVIDATYYSNSKGRIPYEHSESSLDKTVQHMINLKDSLESHFGNRTKSMTIDKGFSSFKPGNGFNSDAHNTDPNNHPIKSSIRRQHSQLRPETEVSKFGRSGEVDKISISDLTVTEQQGAGTEIKSSFASAVAHIRQCGNDHLNIFKTEGHLKEYILSVDKDSYSYVAEIAESDEASPIQHLDLIKLSHNVLSDHQKYKHNPVKSSSKLQVPVSISFSRHNSAFKEVFPKYNHQESSSSLLYASAEYNMDNLGNNQFGLHSPSSSHQNHDGSQSSETSLEIEEYNLDKNFPDILHRDVPDMEIIRGDKLACTSLKGQLIGSEQGGHTDSQYQLLLKILSVQQARMKIQQSQINDANSEIKNHEKEVSNDNVKLEIFKAEASEFEKLELEVKAELEDLEKTEWVHVMDNEQKWEVDIKLQLQSVRDKLEQVELQIRHLTEEAEAKSQHLKTEKKKIEEENKKNEELKKKALIEVPQLKEQLTNLNKTINENEKKLREVERGIYDADVDLKKQEDKIKALEAEFKDERYIDNQTNPPSEELPSISSVSQASIKRHPSSENGEAILKILERQLSPGFLTGDGDNSLGGVISAQHIYRSALAIENPNGVWV